MNPLENIVNSLYGKDNVSVVVGGGVLCRNKNLSFDLKDGRQLFMKYFSSKRHFEREGFLYRLFEETKLLPTPKLEYVGDNFIILQRLSLCPDPDIYKIIKDLARFHSNFNKVRAEINKKLKEQILFKGDSSSIKRVLETICFLSSDIEEFLGKGLTNLPLDSQRLIHGDLYINNVLSDAEGNLRYIDLENAKVDYPEKDNILIILHNPESYQDIINTYLSERSKYEKVNRKEFEFSTRYLSVLKLSEMIYNLDSKRDNYTDRLRETEFAQKFRERARDLIKRLI